MLFGTSMIEMILLTFRRLGLACCSAARVTSWVDTLEFAQTIIFAMQLTASWKMVVQLISTIDFANEAQPWTDNPIPVFGFVLVVILLALELCARRR